LIETEEKMKKLFFILLTLVFASSASATVYKWADERGVMNFTDDYSKVPPNYRNTAEQVTMPKAARSTLSQASSGNVAVTAQPGETATQPPPIAQTLVREGDFAIKLTEALKIGQAKNEAEAESTLASAGIAPKNGWIADYPVTPDIVGELENTIGMAADSGKLRMKKDEALKAFRTAAVELQLPIVAEIPNEYAESSSSTASQYAEPSGIDDYYDTEGPPVVTYYPPPPDYYYMYAWVPNPFWCSGFFFPGFFILHDFHRVIHAHGHTCIVTNHIRDHRTGRFSAIDPVRRASGTISGSRGTPTVRGFNSSEARNGARAIFERSRARTGSNIAAMPMAGKGGHDRNPAYSGSGRGDKKQVYNSQRSRPGFNIRNGNSGRLPVNSQRMGRQYGRSFQRPSTGEARSSSPVLRDSVRSSGPSPHGGGQHFGSSGMAGSGFSGSHQGGSHSSGGSGRGSSRF
jgi:hypothetical protein